MRRLAPEFARRGIVSKRRARSGGAPISRGALYLMLQNRLYRGEVTRKGNAYPGQHEAIIDAEL